MKRLNLFVLGLAALTTSMVFTSCDSSENPAAPTIAFTNGVNEATTANSTYTISGTITSEAGLKIVRYFKVTATDEVQLDMVESFTDKKSFQFQYDVSVSEDMTVKVEATDKDNQVAAKNFVIKYTGGASPVKTYTIKLGSYDASTGSSFASIDGTVYKWADATANSAKVDFLYFYGATNKATIAAPTDSDAQSVFNGLDKWGTPNATKFGTTTVTASEFDAMTDDSEIVSNTGSLTATKINSLAVGDVIGFMTASTSANASKAGLAKVVAITGTTSSGTIDLVVKVQE